MGVSKNRGTPKWMVYNGKPSLKKWMIWGYHYFRKHPYTLYPAFVVNQILNQQYRPFPRAVDKFSWSFNHKIKGVGPIWSVLNKLVIFLATFRYMTYNRQLFECDISHPFEAPLQTLFRWFFKCYGVHQRHIYRLLRILRILKGSI